MEFKLDEAQEKRLKEWQNNIKELFGGREVVVIVANDRALRCAGLQGTNVQHLTKSQIALIQTSNARLPAYCKTPCYMLCFSGCSNLRQ